MSFCFYFYPGLSFSFFPHLFSSQKHGLMVETGPVQVFVAVPVRNFLATSMFFGIHVCFDNTANARWHKVYFWRRQFLWKWGWISNILNSISFLFQHILRSLFIVFLQIRIVKDTVVRLRIVGVRIDATEIVKISKFPLSNLRAWPRLMTLSLCPVRHWNNERGFSWSSWICW